MGNILDRERKIAQLQEKLRKEMYKKDRESRKRKKYILGHILLSEMKDDDELRQTINTILSKKILHSKDRELFELPLFKNQLVIDNTTRRIYIV